MRSNIDHDVFAKKLQSIELANQVEEFLKSQNLEEPVQIPFGHSEYLNTCKKNGVDPYTFSLRSIMTHSVEQTHAEKKNNSAKQKSETNNSTYTPDNSSNRREFNRKARELTWISGQKKFVGKCQKHGEQYFNIRKQGKDQLCSICQREFTRSQNSKRKEKEVKLDA